MPAGCSKNDLQANTVLIFNFSIPQLAAYCKCLPTGLVEYQAWALLCSG